MQNSGTISTAEKQDANLMPNIQIDFAQESSINSEHVEYTRLTRNIELIVKGPPVFNKGIAIASTFIISDGFASFLNERGFLFKLI